MRYPPSAKRTENPCVADSPPRRDWLTPQTPDKAGGCGYYVYVL